MDQPGLQFDFLIGRRMLRSLSVRNLVLIDSLDLEFGPGLCVLTGETGAGKSILLDALGLALGARGDAQLVRHGTESASVSASFELTAGHTAWALLEAQGFDFTDEIRDLFAIFLSLDDKVSQFCSHLIPFTSHPTVKSPALAST